MKKDTYDSYVSHGLEINVCDQAIKVDYLINIPVLKGHCQTKMTCALKNLKGCIPDFEKRRLHQLGLHNPIAKLNDVLKCDLVIVDGIIGDLCFEEGGTPVEMNRLIMGKDPVLVDAFIAESMRYSIEEIGYIKKAGELEIGSTDLEHATIKYLNSPDRNKEAVGIGKCTKNFSFFVPGCPPSAKDIKAYLVKQIL